MSDDSNEIVIIPNKEEKEISSNVINSDMITEKIQELFTRQLNQDETSSIEDIEKIRLQRTAYLELLESVAQFEHLKEVLSNTQHQFKRKDEIDLLNQQFNNYKDINDGITRKIKLINGKIVAAYERKEELNQELLDVQRNNEYDVKQESILRSELANIVLEIDHLNSLIDKETSLLRKTTSGVSELIKTERMSGGRNWAKDSKPLATTQMNIGSKQKDDKNSLAKKGSINSLDLDSVDLENATIKEYHGKDETSESD